MKTKVICGFPGAGKSTVVKYNKFPQYNVVYLDSSKFKNDWPNEYLKEIESHVESGAFDFVMISTHTEVVQFVVRMGYDVELVYPQKPVYENNQWYQDKQRSDIKEMFLTRYQERGDSPEFIEFISDNFWTFVDGLSGVVGENVTHHRVNTCLSDVSFFIWRILGNDNGFEQSVISHWEEWQDDGSSMGFYDCVLKPEFFGNELYQTIRCGVQDPRFFVSIDNEHGILSVTNNETEKTFEFNFKIVLTKR
ncbi:hypothetical protein F485_gp113 [Aeromonas phage CC2]|uniref:Uncharacterized protein n=1 Tax=Aeromonas phage CC2 TaxID=1204516 RepID=I6WBZ4_9CAUD|nr:hypothetical protein F485_gp113 [Aeromonas phage CC2]AFN39475.1 hypothetical protein CC2_190 [Aeromonas phage CC2]